MSINYSKVFFKYIISKETNRYKIHLVKISITYRVVYLYQGYSSLNFNQKYNFIIS